MNIQLPTTIVAIITTKEEAVLGGGAPVFLTENHQTLQETAAKLEKILDAAAHEIDEETMIIVAHL